jgi:O-acetyl-ADP-ribose deacetylase (regulator of RNase III)
MGGLDDIIDLVQGDITEQSVDVIVNAANQALVGGGGVDGAIHRAGGPAIMAECDSIRAQQGGCPTGSAVITTAGRLPAKAVIHTAGPRWAGGSKGEAALLASCYRSCLELAIEHGHRRIAFPSISTGIYGYPVEEAAGVALSTVHAVLEARPSAFDLVRFVLFSPSDLEVYRRARESMRA